jgi:predicted membrane protein (TIGR00267 family)
MGLSDFLVILKESEIIRRYITINSFDGALTIFGIVFASFVAGIQNPSLIILPSMGATIAMGISGMWGAYAAESAEVKKSLNELEKHLLRDLNGTRRYRKGKITSFLVAVVDGLSPMVAALLIIMPFVMTSFGIIGITLAYYISFLIVALLLFSLGMFLGRIAKESVLKNGLKMLLAGVAISIIFYILSLFGAL